MNTNYTLRLNTVDHYMLSKKTISYHAYNDKLKELYISNNYKYAQILEEAQELSSKLNIPFLLQGVQKINDLSSILFIIKKDEELSYKSIEVNADSIDQYEIKEEEALMHLLDLPFNII